MLAEEMEAAQGALVTRAAPPDTEARDSSGSSSRFAQQTLQVFVPLAHRLGMWYFKGELEQRCFALTKPRDFERISSEVSAMPHRVPHRVPWSATWSAAWSATWSAMPWIAADD